MIFLYIHLAVTFAVAALMTFVEVAAAVGGKKVDRVSNRLLIVSWPIVLFLGTMELVCGYPMEFLDIKRQVCNALGNLGFVRSDQR